MNPTRRLASGSYEPGCEQEHPRQRGSVALEAVIVIPVAMVLVLFAVQACLWAHAAALVQSAAAEGDQVACALGGSPGAGVDRAQAFLAATAAAVVAGPTVTSSEPAAGEVQIDVRGTAEGILPWLHLSVTASRRGTVQEFRSAE